jgi:hypothetical protein
MCQEIFMNNDLTGQYELVMENQSKGTVDASGLAKPGKSMIDDGESQAKGQGGDSPEAKKVSKPVEMDKNKNPGHGTIAEDKDISEILNMNKFDELFKRTLVEDNFTDDTPIEQGGEGEFNDELGDFPDGGGEDDDLGEEVDVATELRMVIDRLNAVAEKLGAFDDEESGLEDEGLVDGEGGDADLAPVPEGVTYGKGGKGSAGGPGKGSDGKLGSFPDRTSQMQSKGSQKVKANSAMGKQTMGGKASAGGPGQGKADGKLGSFPDRTNEMQGKGKMVVKGKTGTAGKSIFDC